MPIGEGSTGQMAHMWNASYPIRQAALISMQRTQSRAHNVLRYTYTNKSYKSNPDIKAETNTQPRLQTLLQPDSCAVQYGISIALISWQHIYFWKHFPSDLVLWFPLCLFQGCCSVGILWHWATVVSKLFHSIIWAFAQYKYHLGAWNRLV